jgi:hypothetical protein
MGERAWLVSVVVLDGRCDEVRSGRCDGNDDVAEFADDGGPSVSSRVDGHLESPVSPNSCADASNFRKRWYLRLWYVSKHVGNGDTDQLTNIGIYGCCTLWSLGRRQASFWRYQSCDGEWS